MIINKLQIICKVLLNIFASCKLLLYICKDKRKQNKQKIKIMTKKQLLEQIFTDVKLEGGFWIFKHEGENKSIDDYTFSNLVKNSTYRQLRGEILNRIKQTK